MSESEQVHVESMYRWYSSSIRAIRCFLNSPSNVATPIDTPTIVASATGRIRPAIMCAVAWIEGGRVWCV